jgi:hypothetical protein
VPSARFSGAARPDQQRVRNVDHVRRRIALTNSISLSISLRWWPLTPRSVDNRHRAELLSDRRAIDPLVNALITRGASTTLSSSRPRR